MSMHMHVCLYMCLFPTTAVSATHSLPAYYYKNLDVVVV